eukprot:TRINITY_DN6767_c0_g1_i2.p2 TRINITY_DN6767_c0_g1~~TRINITY_DN6767_c0_g1_i2.p2  ORF type:complete len:267 (+),score=70.15 TRINITY_DN6767_c0_g1_i2:279-1079(+)
MSGSISCLQQGTRILFSLLRAAARGSVQVCLARWDASTRQATKLRRVHTLVRTLELVLLKQEEESRVSCAVLVASELAREEMERQRQDQQLHEESMFTALAELKEATAEMREMKAKMEARTDHGDRGESHAGQEQKMDELASVVQQQEPAAERTGELEARVSEAAAAKHAHWRQQTIQSPNTRSFSTAAEVSPNQVWITTRGDDSATLQVEAERQVRLGIERRLTLERAARERSVISTPEDRRTKEKNVANMIENALKRWTGITDE